MPLDSENAAVLMLHGFYIVFFTEGRGKKAFPQPPDYLMMLAVYRKAVRIQLLQHTARAAVYHMPVLGSMCLCIDML